MSDWISVNERTPLTNTLCLVHMKNDDRIGIISRYPCGAAIAYYCDGVLNNGKATFIDVREGFFPVPVILPNVTHWMPLPEPPKEE